MFNKLAKKIFKLLIDIVKFVQVTLVFLSFFVVLYWILQLAGAKFIEVFAPFFEGIKAFIHTFYNRTVKIDQVSIDFSFLLATFIMLLIAQALKFLVEGIEFLEKKYDSIYNFFKKKSEGLFNIGLEKQYKAQEHRNNKFLLLIQFNLTNSTKDKFFNKDVVTGVDEKQKEVMQKFLEIFGKDLKFQKDLLKEGLLLCFNDFDSIEKVLSEVGNCIRILKKKYVEEQWKVSYIAGIDVYANAGEILPKVKRMIMLLKLNLKDKIACLPTFKQRYSLMKNPTYKIEGQGTYKIEGCEDIFVLEI